MNTFKYGTQPLVFNQSTTNTQSFHLNSSKFSVYAVSAIIFDAFGISTTRNMTSRLAIKLPTPYEWWSNSLAPGQEKASNARGEVLKLRFDWHIIPVNFFSVKCVRFFVSTESEFPKIYRQHSKIAEDFERLLKIAEGLQWFPKIFRRLPKITEGVERFSTTSKQGRQRFPKGFPTNLEHCERVRICSDDFSNVKRHLNFYLIGF